MKRTAIAVANTKKPATAERKAAVERPHKDLTQIQEEVADLASDILLNGGAREDVDLLLTALLRHRVRRMSHGRYFAAKDPAKADQAPIGRQTTWLRSSIGVSPSTGQKERTNAQTRRRLPRLKPWSK